jgi:hypothetical protein
MLSLPQKDLVVLVPDRNIEFTIKGLFSRNNSFGIRSFIYDIFAHPSHDSGCFGDCHSFLRPFINSYSHAMVIFDREGCGRESLLTREEIEVEVEQRLQQNGWGDRAVVIVIDPELENWVWSDSPHVDSVLGWENQNPNLRIWLKERGWWNDADIKPSRPKEALEDALHKVRKPRSSSIYLQLAEKVSFARCSDDSFIKLRTRLQEWFMKTK